jgi:hypothetical protein
MIIVIISYAFSSGIAMTVELLDEPGRGGSRGGKSEKSPFFIGEMADTAGFEHLLLGQAFIRFSVPYPNLA